jgi:hypothetical protein
MPPIFPFVSAASRAVALVRLAAFFDIGIVPDYQDAAWMKGRPVEPIGEVRLEALCETSALLPKRMPPLVPSQTASWLRGSDQLAGLALSDIPIVSE